eukprot:5015265-Prymnesium_polylepis.1
MLSSARHRDGRFDVGKLSTARAFAQATTERAFTHSSRPAPCGELSRHGWLCGRSNFDLNPLPYTALMPRLPSVPPMLSHVRRPSPIETRPS